MENGEDVILIHELNLELEGNVGDIAQDITEDLYHCLTRMNALLPLVKARGVKAAFDESSQFHREYNKLKREVERLNKELVGWHLMQLEATSEHHPPNFGGNSH
jgi:hypothetical protein